MDRKGKESKRIGFCIDVIGVFGPITAVRGPVNERCIVWRPNPHFQLRPARQGSAPLNLLREDVFESRECQMESLIISEEPVSVVTSSLGHAFACETIRGVMTWA